MNIEITVEYNGIRFPVVIGQEYEASETPEFDVYCLYKGELVNIDYTSNEFIIHFKEGVGRFKYIRPVQKEEPRELTHKEIAMNLVGKGVFTWIDDESGRIREDVWATGFSKAGNIINYVFCFFDDLDEPSEKWHNLDTDLLKLIKEMTDGTNTVSK
ncbi:MAG: hypothetical protein M0R51_12660 [Clostridia bacterium]|jgi:hypothetical protein|nr:hypothetical protein [Clostridia bacterium]